MTNVSGMAEKIDAPVPRPRSLSILTAVAPKLNLGARWGGGVTFVAYDCANKPVGTTPDFCVVEDLENYEGGAAIPIFQPFDIWATEICSTLTTELTWLNDRNGVRLDLWESFQIAQELMTGALTGSPSLQSEAVVVGSGAQKAGAALAALEVEIAEQFGNQEMFLHVHPALLNVLFAEFLTEDEGDDDTFMRTPLGHRVIADAGYGTVAPGGDPADAGSFWIYASGQVRYDTNAAQFWPDPTNQSALDRTRNLFQGRARRGAIVVFDPCSVLAVEVDLTATIDDDDEGSSAWRNATVAFATEDGADASIPLPDLPANANRAIVSVEGGDVRWRPDGATTAPTVSEGMLLPAGTTTEMPDGHAALAAVELFVPSGATINVVYGR